MLVQRGAVEPCHAMRIGRKVCRHPVEENADAGAMAGIDEAGKTLWRTEPRAWREQAERLIAPRAAERMLAHRHQLDMGETHLAGIGHQAFGQLVPAGDAPVGMKPRCGVHFVDRDRRVGRLSLRPRPHPRFVVPGVRRRIHDDRRGCRRQFGRPRQRIGFQRQTHAIPPDDGELVACAGGQPRDEQFPHAGRKPQPHRVAPRVPDVEVAHHRHRARIRRPHREPHAVHPVDRGDARSQVRGELEMPALVEQVQIELAEQRSEGVGILGLLHRARPRDAQHIGFRAGDATDEQPVWGRRRQSAKRLAAAARQHLDRQRTRQEDPHHPSEFGLVRTERRERIGDRAVGKRLRHPLRQGGNVDHVVHAVTLVTSCARPCRGTSIQAGRFAAS